MLNKIRASLLGFLVLPYATADQEEIISDLCRAADDLLKENTDLVSIFGDMTTRFELNKIVDPQDEPVDLTVTKDYTGLMGRNYDKIKDICENDFGYDLCSVVSWTHRLETVGNIPALPVDSIPIKREVIEILKPVCFPKSCSEDQIEILHPFPADCDPLIDDCTVQAYDVTCPRTKTTLPDTSTCGSDMIPNGNSIYTRLNFMEGTMKNSCTAELAGGNSMYCSVAYGTFELETTTDFSVDREIVEEYAEYEANCIRSGGRICDTDIVASYDFESGFQSSSIGTISLKESYIQLPLCIPPVCSDVAAETIAIESFRAYTVDSRIVSDCLEEDECGVDLQSITCNEPDISLLPPSDASAPVLDDDAWMDNADLFSPECRSANAMLNSDGAIEGALSTVGIAFEVNKTRTPQTDPVDVTATQDYSGSTGFNFEKIKEICEVDNGYDLCDVTTVTSHSETIGDLPFLPFEVDVIPVTRVVTEVAKPMCFPKSCSDDQINILDPNPGGCDVLNPDAGCEIISYEVTCPERNITNTTQCPFDALEPGNPIFRWSGLLKSAVVGSCVTLVTGTESASCSLQYGSFEVDSLTDFDTYRSGSAEFSSYESMCLSEGGQICNADLTAAYVLPNGSLGDLVLTEDYLQIPLCIVPECSDDDNFVIESFRKYTRNSFTLPNCDEEVCDVFLYSTSCYDSI